MNTGYKAILSEYMNWLDTLGYSNSIIDNCKSCVNEFFTWLEEKQIQSIHVLTNRHIKEYHNYLETRPNKCFKGRLLSASHLNKSFFAIDKLLEFLNQYGMQSVPVPTNKRIKMDEQERIEKIEILTQDEIKILYNSIENTYQDFRFEKRQAKQYELKLILALYYGCGLRRLEGYNIQLQDIDFNKKTVFVHQGKNYKDRIVPMSEGVYRDLQDYVYNFRHLLKLNHNRLFISCYGAIAKKFKYLQNICEDENIKAKKPHLHILRHSIATHLLQNGMSIENIALFLGHSSLDSTQIYTHLI
jgi:integrase/recombinase XerD